MNLHKAALCESFTEDLDEVRLTCTVCLTEVPVSGARSEETSDYVAHFCGLDCYDKWRDGQPEREPESPLED
jgi:hypothetical protein